MLAVNAKSKLSEAESANVIAESAGATNAKSARPPTHAHVRYVY